MRSTNPSFECKSQCSKAVAAGGRVQLTAVADARSTFFAWQGACSGSGDCTVTLDADRDVTATFTALPPPPPGQVRVAVSLTGKGAGRVTSSPPGIACPGVCAMTVPAGTTVVLSAAASASSRFAGWTGACTGQTGVCSFAAASDRTASAEFAANGPPPPSPSACDGIAPPADVAMTAYVAHRGDGCLSGLGDQEGTLALPATNWRGVTIDFVRTSGVFLQTQGVGSFEPNLLQQPQGLAAVTGPGYLGPRNFVAFPRWDHAGNPLTAGYRYGDHLARAADPAGGVLVAGNLSTADPGPADHVAQMFTGGSAPFAVKWGPKPLASAGAVLGAGVDLLGRSLVVTDGAPKFGGGHISGQWFERDGTPLTGEFVLVRGFTPGPATWVETSPLIGGGLLVRRMDQADSPVRHSVALVVVPSGVALASPAPAWMVSRRDVQLQLARGRRGYAALPYGAAKVACSQRVEVLAPDGTSCGVRDYPIAAGTCDTKDLTLGMDGTVIQPLPTSLEPNDGSRTCTWRWWTGAVR
ncbi:MAG: hypothetical protein NVS2B9_00970 [Myxococcales bacterium]